MVCSSTMPAALAPRRSASKSIGVEIVTNSAPAGMARTSMGAENIDAPDGGSPPFAQYVDKTNAPNNTEMVRNADPTHRRILFILHSAFCTLHSNLTPPAPIPCDT